MKTIRESCRANHPEVRPLEAEFQAAPATRVLYLDILRVAAVFMVVVLHVSCRALLSGAPGTFPWNAANLFNCCTRWCVPVFVMISGALFLGRVIPVGRLCSKYIGRLLRVFALWSLFYAVLDMVRAAQHHASLPPETLVRRFLFGHYHLWFLYMMAGLYILVPFLGAIVREPRIARHFLAVGAVFAFLLPETGAIMARVYPQWGDIMPGILGEARIHFFLGFPVYFVLGYVLDRMEERMSGGRVALLCIVGGLCILATGALTTWASVLAGKLDETFNGDGNVTVLFPAVAIFVLCRYLFGGQIRREKLEVCTRWLSRHVFGIYLVHAFVLEFLEGIMGLWALSFNPLLAIPVTSFVAFFLSLFLSWLLEKLPFVGKWIV